MINEKEIKVEESNWFESYDKPQENKDQKPIFEMKLKEGELARTEEIIFVSDGIKTTTRFGDTIVFNISHDKIDKVWFIKVTQYNLLNPIAKERKKGTLVGKSAKVQRVGSGAKETKWSIQFK